MWTRGPLLSRDVDIVPGPVYGRPSQALVTLAVIAFACLLAEGAAGDWSGVYMNDVLGTGEGAATAAFVAFSLTMTLGRVVGDRLTAAWGAVSLTRRAGALGSIGLGVSLLFDNPLVAVIGFACLGAGLATVVPIVFRAAGQRTPAPGAGIAAVSTVGYTAFLVGPPAIGFLAEAIGLRASLGVVAAPRRPDRGPRRRDAAAYLYGRLMLQARSAIPPSAKRMPTTGSRKTITAPAANAVAPRAAIATRPRPGGI